MTIFFDSWMWMGLGCAVTMLIILFCTEYFHKDQSVSRWFDPKWLVWVASIAYMIHNVEEYGIDFTGTHLNFVNAMRDLFGTSVSDWAFLGCNIPLIWIASPLLAYLCSKLDLKGMATGMSLFGLMNGLSHLVQGFNMGYNSGMVTGIVIFIPFAIWTIYVVYGKKHLSWLHCILTFLVGLLYHVLLIVGVQLAVKGMLMGFAQGIYMTFDAILFFILIYAINKSKLGRWK